MSRVKHVHLRQARNPSSWATADDTPACCGCSRPMTWSQPDPRRPAQLLATCNNPLCGEWSIWVVLSA